MATYNYGIDLPFRADVDMDNYQYHFVVAASTAGYVKPASASRAQVLGVLQNDPSAGDAATVRVFGVSKVVAEAASAITYGQVLTSSSRAMAQTMVPSASMYSAGMALEALASGSDVTIQALILPSVRYQ